MEAHRRARLLRALDIDVWSPRSASPVTVADADELPVVPAAAPAEISAPRRAPPASRRPEPTPPAGLLPDLEVPAPAYVAPADWQGLADAVRGCTRCKLCKTRTNTVFGVGPLDAPLMVIGEGPGAEEDLRGEPFVGAAGKLLDAMLQSVGRARSSNVYIANVVKCRPPGNRDPEADEVAACRPYLDRQIELLQPKLIVALGRVAAQRLLSSNAPLSKLRGVPQVYGAAGTPVLVSYHPAYLLRTPADKAKSWLDLKQAHRLLAGR
ncbi:MAG: uracil-DNA glycosylase [Gammaproteobacteria bacterium]|nr:uracil-DNA glycosylase [Gammaproteobacteria bacterium]